MERWHSAASDNVIQGAQFSSAGIAGNGGLPQLGPGMVTLTAANTYLGPTTISAGTLQLGTGAAGQDGSIGGAGGVTNNGTIAYNLAGSQTAGYSIGGSGNLSVIGSGTRLCRQQRLFRRQPHRSQGVLQVGNSAKPLGASSSLSISAGTVNSAGIQSRRRRLSGTIGRGNHQQRPRGGDFHPRILQASRRLPA